MSKKNIDNLFQEKLHDFREIPDEKVWVSISDSLDKKKSRKVIPIWWKLGGVAALLAVLFVSVNPFGEDSNIPPIISDTENLENNNLNEEEYKIRSADKSEKTIQIADTESIDTGEANMKKNQNSKVPVQVEKTNTANVISPNNKTVENSQLANVDTKKPDSDKTANGEVDNPLIADDINIYAETKAEIAKSNSEQDQKNLLENNSPEGNFEIAVLTKEEVADVAKEELENEISDEGQKKSIFDEIEKQNEAEEAIAESSKDKWSVGANVAPVYFSSFGEGSPIDPAFNSNTKSGELNMSYGLSVAYNVTDKLSIRTGVNKVDFGYDTNEVEFSPSLQGSLSSRLNNVNYSESAENVVVASKRQNSFAFADKSTDVIANDISRNGVIAQEFGYIEVPIELDYSIIENRFGVNFIGGVSTLFLTNNSVMINDTNETIELGEANNLNNVNFSTNIGFGLNYKFTQKIRLNVEPVFKYQLGTFSDISGSFRPFSVGVYSGLNYKF